MHFGALWRANSSLSKRIILKEIREKMLSITIIPIFVLMKSQKAILRKKIAEKLVGEKVFWSYESVNSTDLNDEVIIEKALIHLDIEDINTLFHIFPWKKIRNVWLTEVVIQDPLYHSMNILLAYLYFHIRKPEDYIEKYIRRYQLS